MDCENEFLGVCARRNEREYEEKNSMDSAGAMTLSIAACGNKTGDPVADDGNITAEATEGELDTSANLEGSCADILDEIYKTAKTDDDYFSYTDDFENVEITEAEEEYI